MKIEFNSEYRFPVFWVIESAIFLDAGNIWNINSNTPTDNINKFFYDQIAISSGIGFRFDFTYALVRLDFGFRLRNPYPFADNIPSKWIPVDQWSWSNNINPNFALGLPF
jgi:hemolysin activation/secretion protein